MIAGRLANSDELSLQRCVTKQREPTRARNYHEMRQHWLSMTTVHRPIELPGKAHWQVPGLTVGIRPEFVLMRGRRALVTKLWLKSQEPSADGIKAMQWLIDSHMD